MKLDEDVDPEAIARDTHGFVGKFSLSLSIESFSFFSPCLLKKQTEDGLS